MRVRCSRLRVGVTLASVGVALRWPGIGAAGAQAASLPGPSSISEGITDDPTFLDPSETEATRNAWFARGQQVHESWVRLGAYWQFIATTKPRDPTNPSDPSYAWYWLDPAVRDAAAHGIKNPHTDRIPADLGAGQGRAGQRAFVETQRQGGRTVRSSRGEAIFRPLPGSPESGALLAASHLLPGLERAEHQHPGLACWKPTRSGRLVPQSPYIYRRLLNAIYFNVKAVQPKAKVLLAGLDPYGDPPGGIRMRPVLFMREVLCLRGDRLRREYCPDPAHFDAIDHHPYASTPWHHAYNRYDVAVPDMWRLRHIVAVALRKRLVRPIGPKPLWVTEISWNSNPPASYGVPLTTQARRLAATFYAFWRQHITHMFWFLISDSHVIGALGDGLFFANGVPKPAATAFRFPFVALRGRNGVVTLWGHAPAAGTVSVQSGSGHGWRTMLRLRTTRGGIFYAHRRLPPHLVLRARVGSMASLSWR